MYIKFRNCSVYNLINNKMDSKCRNVFKRLKWELFRTYVFAFTLSNKVALERFI